MSTKEYYQRYRQRNIESIRAKDRIRAKRNWDKNPAKQREYNHKQYIKHRQKRSEWGSLYVLAIKQKVINRYGGECKFCHAKDIACLSIDHINDDGANERRRFRLNNGTRWYRILLKSTIRTDLQVLCMNCQWRKRIHGPDHSKWPDINEPPGNFVLPPDRRIKYLPI